MEIVELVPRNQRATRIINSGLGRRVAVVNRTNAWVEVAPQGAPNAQSCYFRRVELAKDPLFKIREVL